MVNVRIVIALESAIQPDQQLAAPSCGSKRYGFNLVRDTALIGQFL